MLLLAKNLLFTIVVPGTVAVYVPVFSFSHGPVVMSASSAAAACVLLIGALIYAWCLWDFASFGRGTPAPIDAPRRLVVRGLYRYSRNPMYVGVLTVICGWALLFQSLSPIIYAFVVAACFHVFVVFYEEPHLKSVFGPSYEQYSSRVGRWLSFRKPAPG
ncbi:MAG: methyltransferase family protein [Woeseiaceae bacterium]